MRLTDGPLFEVGGTVSAAIQSPRVKLGRFRDDHLGVVDQRGGVVLLTKQAFAAHVDRFGGVVALWKRGRKCLERLGRFCKSVLLVLHPTEFVVQPFFQLGCFHFREPFRESLAGFGQRSFARGGRFLTCEAGGRLFVEFSHAKPTLGDERAFGAFRGKRLKRGGRFFWFFTCQIRKPKFVIHRVGPFVVGLGSEDCVESGDRQVVLLQADMTQCQLEPCGQTVSFFRLACQKRGEVGDRCGEVFHTAITHAAQVTPAFGVFGLRESG